MRKKPRRQRRDEAALAWHRPLRCTVSCTFQPGRAEHGLSVFGDLKYPASFSHFDYVNPDAPKGGRMALIGIVANDTFDSFNGYILKGDAGPGAVR